jgi:hypothetical protein
MRRFARLNPGPDPEIGCRVSEFSWPGFRLKLILSTTDKKNDVRTRVNSNARHKFGTANTQAKDQYLSAQFAESWTRLVERSRERISAVISNMPVFVKGFDEIVFPRDGHSLLSDGIGRLLLRSLLSVGRPPVRLVGHAAGRSLHTELNKLDGNILQTAFQVIANNADVQDAIDEIFKNLYVDKGYELGSGQVSPVNGVNVFNPVNGSYGSSGLSRVNGANGANGANVIDGTVRVHGANGINGIGQVNGANDINGAVQVNGTSGVNGVGQVNGANRINGAGGVKGANGASEVEHREGTNGINGVDPPNEGKEITEPSGANVASGFNTAPEAKRYKQTTYGPTPGFSSKPAFKFQVQKHTAQSAQNNTPVSQASGMYQFRAIQYNPNKRAKAASKRKTSTGPTNNTDVVNGRPTPAVQATNDVQSSSTPRDPTPIVTGQGFEETDADQEDHRGRTRTRSNARGPAAPIELDKEVSSPPLLLQFPQSNK